MKRNRGRAPLIGRKGEEEERKCEGKGKQEKEEGEGIEGERSLDAASPGVEKKEWKKTEKSGKKG